MIHRFIVFSRMSRYNQRKRDVGVENLEPNHCCADTGSVPGRGNIFMNKRQCMNNLMKCLCVAGLCFPSAALARAPSASAPGKHKTDWFRAAKYGVFMHFLPGNPGQLEQVKAFDVEALAAQLQALGARYFFITLGQNSGFFNAPNAAYDRITGYA
ncbi:MAG: hypothetical protein ACP5XB_08825, partial [Isosphaeraceae bacterium]